MKSTWQGIACGGGSAGDEPMIDEPQSILIVRLSALGDVINSLPILGPLKQKWPNAQISWIVEPASAPIVEAQAHVDNTFVLPRKDWQKALTRPGRWKWLAGEVRTLLNDLEYQSFDLAFDMQGNYRSGLITRLSGAKLRVGYHAEDRKEHDFGFTNVQAPKMDSVRHRAQKAVHLLDAIGIEPSVPTASLAVEEHVLASVDERLKKYDVEGRPLITIHTGTSSFGAYKRWTDAGYRELSRRLCGEHNAVVLFTWAGKEREQAEQLVKNVHPDAHVCFETSLMELAAICKRSTVFVGADTGPGHVASLVGCPVVSIFGPKDPFIYRPYFSPCYVVQRTLWCRPCFSRTCSAPVCLTSIPVHDVYEAVCRAMDGARPTVPLRVMENPLLE